MFAGLARVKGKRFARAGRSVDSLLNDRHVIDATDEAAQHIDRALAKVEQVTGIPDDEVIKAPAFYERQ